MTLGFKNIDLRSWGIDPLQYLSEKQPSVPLDQNSVTAADQFLILQPLPSYSAANALSGAQRRFVSQPPPSPKSDDPVEATSAKWIRSISNIMAQADSIRIEVDNMPFSGNVPGNPIANDNNPGKRRRPESWPISSKVFPGYSLTVPDSTHGRVTAYIEKGEIIFAALHYDEGPLVFYIPGNGTGHILIGCLDVVGSPPSMTFDQSFSKSNPVTAMDPQGNIHRQCSDFDQLEALIKRAKEYKARGEKNPDAGLNFIVKSTHLLSSLAGSIANRKLGADTWIFLPSFGGRFTDLGLYAYYNIRPWTFPRKIKDTGPFFLSPYPGQKPQEDVYFNPNFQYADEFGKVWPIPAGEELKKLNEARAKKKLFPIPEATAEPFDATGIDLANDPKKMAQVPRDYRMWGKVTMNYPAGATIELPDGTRFTTRRETTAVLRSDYETVEVIHRGKKELRSRLVTKLRFENFEVSDLHINQSGYELSTKPGGKAKFDFLEFTLPLKQKHPTGSKVPITDFFNIETSGIKLEMKGLEGQKLSLIHQAQNLAIDIDRGGLQELVFDNDAQKTFGHLTNLYGQGIKLNHKNGNLTIEDGVFERIDFSGTDDFKESDFKISKIRSQGFFNVKLAEGPAAPSVETNPTQKDISRPFEIRGQGSSTIDQLHFNRKTVGDKNISTLRFKVDGIIDHAEVPGTPAGDISWTTTQGTHRHSTSGEIWARISEPKDKSAGPATFDFQVNFKKIPYASFDIANSPNGLKMKKGSSYVSDAAVYLSPGRVYFRGNANFVLDELKGFKIPGLELGRYHNLKLNGPLLLDVLPDRFTLEHPQDASTQLSISSEVEKIRYRFHYSDLNVKLAISRARANLNNIHKISYQLSQDKNGQEIGALLVESDENLIYDIHGTGTVVMKDLLGIIPEYPIQLPLSNLSDSQQQHSALQKKLLADVSAEEMDSFCDKKGDCGNFIRVGSVRSNPDSTSQRFQFSNFTFFVNQHNYFAAVGAPLLWLNAQGNPTKSKGESLYHFYLNTGKKGAGSFRIRNDLRYQPVKVEGVK